MMTSLNWKLRIVLVMFVLLLGYVAFVYARTENTRLPSGDRSATPGQPVARTAVLYDSLHLDSLGLSRDAYTYAVRGQQYLEQNGKLANDSILSIVDFSLPSSRKRLFVIDTKNGRLLFNTFVSHGRNSGTLKATSFSNKPNSYKSSLGFYITGDTYNGQHGYSLRLEGEEAGINDNAMNRGIVMHSARYVDEDLISSQGYIGRSQGCPAIPEELHKAIISQIRNGSCLFLYSPDKYYASHSPILRSGLIAQAG
jgi:hypothetical protein